jgi:hypothetical protein
VSDASSVYFYLLRMDCNHGWFVIQVRACLIGILVSVPLKISISLSELCCDGVNDALSSVSDRTKVI